MRKMLSDSIFDLKKCPNQKTHENESTCFPVGALCEVLNRIWEHFSHKVLHNYYSKKKLDCFGLYLTKSKNGFSIVFSNLVRKGSRGFFQARKQIFSPNGLFHPTKQLWIGESFSDITYFCRTQEGPAYMRLSRFCPCNNLLIPL